MPYKKREAFSSSANAFGDLKESNNQYAKMVVYWGTACNSLQTQLKVLMHEWQRAGLHELIEVSNADMNVMRQCLVTGIPMCFSRYPDGVTKLYPVPEKT